MVGVKIIVLTFFHRLPALHGDTGKDGNNCTRFQRLAGGGHSPGCGRFPCLHRFTQFHGRRKLRIRRRDLPIGIYRLAGYLHDLLRVVAPVFTGCHAISSAGKQLSTETAEPLTMALNMWLRRSVGHRTCRLRFGRCAYAVLLVFPTWTAAHIFSMARDGLLPPVFAKVASQIQDAARYHES